ncbi:ABC transporter ATP-binding protein [Candidatus Thorarchaeota archaeon]|nr:MAG: ABC transporter ATP-binding protein [Candidatus Thorarchaeota archaeon]
MILEEVRVMPLVEFSEFSFKYLGSESLALDKVSMKIERGEYIIITGPSGCGKTSLCRAMNGLVPHFHRGYIAGHVYVNGKDTRESKVSDLATVAGLVFQNPANQLVTLNVEKEIAFGPENLGIDPSIIRTRIEKLIHRLGLENLRDKHPHEMSGGEQQRVALAATLALEPTILIADEPTSNLDPKNAELILDILSDLNRQGMTILLVEHRLDLVARDASRVIVMDEGRIIADGAPYAVLSSDLAAEIGIGIPKATQIYRRLKAGGIHLDEVPLTGDELAKLVQEAIRQ